jgi:hypothetical protein
MRRGSCAAARLFTFTAALSIAAGVGVDTTVGRPVSIPPRRFDRYFESWLPVSILSSDIGRPGTFDVLVSA